MTSNVNVSLALLLGDLNSQIDDPAYQTIINATKGTDSWRALYPSNSGYTFNSSNPVQRIDLAIVIGSKGMPVSMSIVQGNISTLIDGSPFGYYLSDHLAVESHFNDTAPASSSSSSSSASSSSSSQPSSSSSSTSPTGASNSSGSIAGSSAAILFVAVVALLQ